MIEKIHIENFKSIQNLDLELGRVNVLIGENGSGKTNVLEAIGVMTAANKNKLDSTYLSTIGIRYASAKEYKAGFDIAYLNHKIRLSIVENQEKITYELNGVNGEDLKIENGKEILSLLLKKTEQNLSNQYDNFAIYCPENTYLRRTDEEAHFQPIGIKGEGLLNFLSDLLEKDPDSFDAIKEQLQILNWFEDFDIKTNFLTGGKSMVLKDRFLKEGIKTISLKNANEGFLFVLFYITLFSSEKTPKFFAIDNFDNALNPKLCSELIKILTKIVKEKGKQVILTTHNPAVLDGLDLNDDEQRLFTVSRSHKTGETKIKRIEKKVTPFGETPIRLSEKFMNGSIGGLPKNF